MATTQDTPTTGTTHVDDHDHDARDQSDSLALSAQPPAPADGDDAHDNEPATADAHSAHSAAEAASRRWPFRRRWRHLSAPAFALAVGLTIATALGGVTGWLAYQTAHLHRDAQQRAEFIEVARQAALNLTTIDWQHAEGDIQRILNSASGTFFDDFAKRSQPFVDVVKQTKSKSEGTVTAAGLEVIKDNSAQVLVALTVKTSNASSPDSSQRAWRMRIFVQKAGNDVKVDNVEFVP